MVERSAAWCDGVIPYVAVRQWVLTVPWPRRFLFARRPKLGEGEVYLLGGPSCRLLDATIHPGATETCGDDLDQNCDGSDLACP